MAATLWNSNNYFITPSRKLLTPFPYTFSFLLLRKKSVIEDMQKIKTGRIVKLNHESKRPQRLNDLLGFTQFRCPDSLCWTTKSTFVFRLCRKEFFFAPQWEGRMACDVSTRLANSVCMLLGNRIRRVQKNNVYNFTKRTREPNSFGAVWRLPIWSVVARQQTYRAVEDPSRFTLLCT